MFTATKTGLPSCTPTRLVLKLVDWIFSSFYWITDHRYPALSFEMTLQFASFDAHCPTSLWGTNLWIARLHCHRWEKYGKMIWKYMKQTMRCEWGSHSLPSLLCGLLEANLWSTRELREPFWPKGSLDSVDLSPCPPSMDEFRLKRCVFHCFAVVKGVYIYQPNQLFVWQSICSIIMCLGSTTVFDG